MPAGASLVLYILLLSLLAFHWFIHMIIMVIVDNFDSSNFQFRIVQVVLQLMFDLTQFYLGHRRVKQARGSTPTQENGQCKVCLENFSLILN